MQQKPFILEAKQNKKIKPFEIGDEVYYFLLGEEPKIGRIINKTDYKGKPLFQVDFGSGDQKWGSIKQLKYVTPQIIE